VQAAFVQVRVEGAVLADDRVHRPQAREDLGPGDAAAGHRDQVQAGVLQLLHGKVGGRGQPAIGSQGAVDVRQHTADAAQRGAGQGLDGLHGGAFYMHKMRSRTTVIFLQILRDCPVLMWRKRR